MSLEKLSTMFKMHSTLSNFCERYVLFEVDVFTLLGATKQACFGNRPVVFYMGKYSVLKQN